jgi:type I restriction enzyme M protein
MNVKESAKEKLFNQLDNCLNALGSYDVNSLMPLLYVVVAHHQGHLLSIIGKSGLLFSGKMRIQSVEAVDGNESEILKSIRRSVDPHYFEGQSAEIVFRFYESCNQFIQDNYQDIIEHIISFYSSRGGRYAGITNTPLEIATLMASLIEDCHPIKVYDPCAGLCTFSLRQGIKDIPFVGQEIMPFTKVLADVRLDAAEKNATIFNEDSTLEWRDNDGCDVLASELPFGVRLHDVPTDRNRPKLLEDYILYKFIKTPSLKRAVLMVSMGTCWRRDNFDIRKTLCEKNWVESVIKMPAGILPNAGVSTAIVVLNKERNTKDIKFVLADDCIINSGRTRLLDYQSVIERIEGRDEKQSASVSVGLTFEKDCTLDPSAYVQERIEVLPGQKIVKFSSLATKDRGVRRFDETKGRVLQPEHMCESIAEMHTRNITIEIVELTKSAYVKICSKGLIFNVRADRFFIKTDEEPLFISPNYSCFTVLEDKCLPEYLADCVVNAKRFRESALMGQGMPRIDWENLLIPIYENLDSQKQIVQRIYRQEQNELKKKLESLQLLSGKSSDLIHNLGITFTKISAGIGKLLKDGSNETIEGLNDNVQFALRQINSTGTDFAFVQPELEKVNVYDTLMRYVKGWENFGYKTFDILPIKMEVSDDTKVEIDTTLFYTLLDCIFINAHQHGFNKRENPENKVLIEVEGVAYKEDNYIRIGISNNGNPLPDNFSVRDFVARGVVGINSSQDGIGGDHVCKIAHHFGGFISIDDDSEWLTFNVLLPVYITSNDTKYIEYECECV